MHSNFKRPSARLCKILFTHFSCLLTTLYRYDSPSHPIHFIHLLPRPLLMSLLFTQSLVKEKQLTSKLPSSCMSVLGCCHLPTCLPWVAAFRHACPVLLPPSCMAALGCCHLPACLPCVAASFCMPALGCCHLYTCLPCGLMPSSSMTALCCCHLPHACLGLLHLPACLPWVVTIFLHTYPRMRASLVAPHHFPACLP
jgi:hypothetical protein